MIYQDMYSAFDYITIMTYDTEAQTVTTTVDGNVTETRPMTVEEADNLAHRQAVETSDANTTQMVVESGESVDKLVLVVENLNAITDMTNADINANPAAIIKDVARELKTVARQANREARLTSGRTDSTHTGTEVPE
jgi:ClpP class serine protease